MGVAKKKPVKVPAKKSASATKKPTQGKIRDHLGQFDTLYTDELADRICDLLISGLSMVDICALEGMPDRVTVVKWQARYPEFGAKVAAARAEQADYMDDLIYKTAKDSTNDTAGGDRVRLAAYMWRAEHLKPKKYGKQLNINADVSTHNSELSDILSRLLPEERDELRAILNRASKRPAPRDDGSLIEGVVSRR